MITKEQILEAVKAGKGTQCLDSRDFSRLTQFFSVDEVGLFGFEVEDKDKWVETEYTKEKVLNSLKGDLAFAFEKALNKRGLSSGMMFEVIKMWMWVLDDPLQHHSDDNYAMYGLPLYKAVALKYGFENPIGNDEGSEDKYNG